MDSIFDDYENRKVSRFEIKEEGLIISTAYVTDTGLYETAVSHPRYNDRDWIIVEEYGTFEKAKEGHMRWIKIMVSDPLPEKLKDVSSNIFAVLLAALSGKKMEHDRK